MKAVVVYESVWGNTASVARAIADGIGDGSRALSTAQATAAELEGVDLIVAGAPLMAFSLPTDATRGNIAKDRKAPTPDLAHPSMRNWLKSVAPGTGCCAAFETRFKWSPGSATKGILGGLEGAGYRPVGREKFLVAGTYGPLKDGEVERARAWGAMLSETARQ